MKIVVFFFKIVHLSYPWISENSQIKSNVENFYSAYLCLYTERIQDIFVPGYFRLSKTGYISLCLLSHMYDVLGTIVDVEVFCSRIRFKLFLIKRSAPWNDVRLSFVYVCELISTTSWVFVK